MKRIRILLLVALLASGVTLYAYKPAPKNHCRRPRKCVSLPLDGGLLAVLGVAGITYYLVRRKSKKKEL